MWSTCRSSCSLAAPARRAATSAFQGLKLDSASLKTRKPRSCLLCAVQVELARVLVVELLDDAADALFGDVGDGRVVLAAGGLGKLDEDELAVAAVLLVQVEDGVGGGTGTGEEVEDDVASSGRPSSSMLESGSTGFGIVEYILAPNKSSSLLRACCRVRPDHVVRKCSYGIIAFSNL